jgi:hypothetical protein
MDKNSRPHDGPPIVVRDDIVSVTNLLLMAQASAKESCIDRVCVSLMDQCIARLLQRNGLSRASLGDAMVVKESVELPVLLRVLRYARSEALHRLHDADCADLLGECIERLSKTHRLSQILYSPSVALN